MTSKADKTKCNKISVAITILSGFFFMFYMNMAHARHFIYGEWASCKMDLPDKPNAVFEWAIFILPDKKDGSQKSHPRFVSSFGEVATILFSEPPDLLAKPGVLYTREYRDVPLAFKLSFLGVTEKMHIPACGNYWIFSNKKITTENRDSLLPFEDDAKRDKYERIETWDVVGSYKKVRFAVVATCKIGIVPGYSITRYDMKVWEYEIFKNAIAQISEKGRGTLADENSGSCSLM